MTEKGFTPTPREERATWKVILSTAGEGRQLVRRQPILLILLGVALFYGLYSEGFDRLWTAHLLENFALPLVEEVEPVVWFGIIRAMLLVISLAATEIVRRRVDATRSGPMARVLMVNAGLIVIALAGFGLARRFWVALVLFWLTGALRSVAAPLGAAWFNMHIDQPQVRATMFSVAGQTDAIGQIAGGPVVGAIGNVSIRAALVASALLLTPVLLLYALVSRWGEND